MRHFPDTSQTIIAEQGWNDDTMIVHLLGYIATIQPEHDAGIMAYLQAMADEENGTPGLTQEAIPAADTPPTPEQFIERALTLSTGHITKDQAEALEYGQIQGLVIYDKEEYGWWISLATGWLDCPDQQGLYACLRMAQNLGCDWLQLDSAAPTHPDLPTFGW